MAYHCAEMSFGISNMQKTTQEAVKSCSVPKIGSKTHIILEKITRFCKVATLAILQIKATVSEMVENGLFGD